MVILQINDKKNKLKAKDGAFGSKYQKKAILQFSILTAIFLMIHSAYMYSLRYIDFLENS